MTRNIAMVRHSRRVCILIRTISNSTAIITADLSLQTDLSKETATEENSDEMQKDKVRSLFVYFL